jgi:phage terminase large subunit-like protein
VRTAIATKHATAAPPSGKVVKRPPLREIKNPTRGDLVIQFIQTLKVPDGPDAGKLIRLRDWQIRDIKKIYDPLTEVLVDGVPTMVRAVRQAVLTEGRKNGKTSLAGGFVLAHLVGPEATWNAQIYSAAYEREQAGLIFKTAASMVLQDEELTGLCRPTDSGKKISCAVNNSFYKALSAESRSKHGLNPTFVVFDELAQFHTDRTLFDVLTTSMGAQREPLMLVISTQAADDTAVLSELIDYGREINAGAISDDSFVLVDYSTPSDEELAKLGLTIWDEEVWKMGNPALGDFRSIDEMRNFVKKARKIPSAELTFRNLYLNQRIAARASLVGPTVWAACSREYTLDQLRGRPAMVSLDLSSKLDLTAAAATVYVEEDDTYAILAKGFTPDYGLEDREKRDRAKYHDWIAAGHLIAVPGKSIDYDHMVPLLSEWRDALDVRGYVYDRWRIDSLKKAMATMEFEVDEEMFKPFGQGFRDMSPAIEFFEELLVSERYAHGGNPLLRWCIANAIAEKDAAGNRKLTKGRSYGRIDLASAAVMGAGAFNLAGVEEDASPIALI